MPQQFRYAAVDLDGTLLSSQHKPSEKTIEAIRKLDSQGFGIIVATGRALSTVYDTILALDLPHPLPVVCSNGARGVLCQPSGYHSTGVATTQLFDSPVPEPVARRTITLAKELGLFSQYYVGDSIYADPQTEAHLKMVELYKEMTGAKTECVDDMMAILEQNPPPSKQLVICEREEQEEALKEYEAELKNPLYLSDDGSPPTLVKGSNGWFLEVLNPAVNKGTGLKRLCEEHLDVELSAVVSFGDGDNDVEFLQMSGWGIAMQNAYDVTKQAANQTIDLTNDDDGVVRTLQSMEQNGQLLFDSTQT